MWGFGKSTPPPPKEKPKSEFEAGMPKFDDIGFDFAKMNLEDDSGLDDPELLAELEHMMAVERPPARKPAPTPPPSRQAAGSASSPLPAAASVKQPIVQPKLHEELVEYTTLDLTDVMNDAEPNVEVSDKDLEDPDLLAELHAVTGGSNHDEEDSHFDSISYRGQSIDPTPQYARSYALPSNLASSSVPSVAPSASNIPNTSVHNSYSTMPQAATASDHFVVPTRSTSIKGSATVVDSNNKPEDTSMSLASMMAVTDPALLSKYIQSEKVNAVNKKRAGDLNGALESLKTFKALEGRLAQLGPSSSPAAAPISNPMNTPDRQLLAASSALASPPARSASVEKKNGILAVLTQRQDEYKRAALAFRDTQNLPKAQEMLTTFKALNAAIITVKQTGDLPATFQLPPPAPTNTNSTPKSNSSNATSSTPTKSQLGTKPSVSPLGANRQAVKPKASTMSLKQSQSNSISVSSDTSVNTDDVGDVWQYLKNSLESQVSLGTSLASHYLKANRKDLAGEFHRLSKGSASDLAIVTSLLQQPHSRPPIFTHKNVTYEYEHYFAELPNEEMEIVIVAGHGLGTREVKGEDVAGYVVFDLGWPTDEDGTPMAESKGETPVISRNPNPEFNYKKSVRYDKSRSFQRFLERKTATFDVMHSRGLSLIWKPICLGRANVPLSALLKSAEFHEVIQLVDPENPRKPTGGRLEVRFRMRQAFLGPELISKSHRWLTLDTSPSTPAARPPLKDNLAPPTSSPSRPSSPAVTKPVSPRTPSPSTLRTPDSATRSPGISAGVKKIPSPVVVEQAAAVDDDVEALEIRFLSADGIASNSVLEAEQKQLETQINTLKAQRKPVPDDLLMRENEYRMRMEYLVTMVSVGQLTMPAYLAQLKEAIQTSRIQALAFKRGGKLDLAKQALVRVHLMDAEIKGVEENQEGEEDAA
ncbi:hypothetical protein SmJEL517_g04666 [Synchytrium microbalum]|uniref:C2 domain-containing protein n=1 Tax=Synchytrium microbalum TaxID=1806994 RepID=A0A507C3U5_9FUNG|nr:uncharacterized protein SmJEL517_g04666 [Synchytrium microbalum]TPX32193.1 hypothetical protein SmJEL517_g04666 [Synchytrium microbalum]